MTVNTVENQSKSDRRLTAVIKNTSSKISIIIPPEIRYMNPLMDHEFKRIFSNSIVTKIFLNHVLELEDEIVKVQYNKIKKNSVIKKTDPYFNLQCTTSKGENMIVEMWNLPLPTLIGGALYSASVPIYCDFDDGLKYSVNIESYKIDKDIVDDNEPYCHRVQLIDRENLRISYKYLVFEFVELSEAIAKKENTLAEKENALAAMEKENAELRRRLGLT